MTASFSGHDNNNLARALQLKTNRKLDWIKPMPAHKNDHDLGALFQHPDMFLWQLQGSKALFVEMDRSAYQNSLFCDARIQPLHQNITALECQTLLQYQSGLPVSPADIGYIFHMAHCGSTLYARALDLPDKNIVYREPAALRQLAAAAAATFLQDEAPAAWSRILNLVCHMLGRRYEADGPALVKGNVPVNFIISRLIAAGGAGTRGVVLYATLENYLLAVLKSPQHRQWVHGVSRELGKGIDAVAGTTPQQRESMSDAAAAACLWLTQIRLFDQALQQHESLRSLDTESLYNEPQQTLMASFNWFGQDIDENRAAAIVAGELFSQYSKDPRQNYDNEARLADRAQLRETLLTELEEAASWLERCGGPMPMQLIRPLTGVSPALASS